MSRRPESPRARRVAPTPDPGETPDYADAFEIHLDHDDSRTAEQWARSGLEGAPSVLRHVIRGVHRHVLRFDLGDPGSPEHVLGWRVAESQPDLVRLQTESSLMRAMILGQRIDGGILLQTRLFYRSGFAPTLWRVIGPIHRAVAPYLLERAARDTA